MIYILYNPQAGNNTGYEKSKELDNLYKNETLEYMNITEINDYDAFFSDKVNENDSVIIAGGDGTLNRFINNTESLTYPCTIYYYPVGSGNDFARDVDKEKPFPVNEYIENLPIVEVKGKKYRFINGVGYGIYGYCCEVGDSLRGKSEKPINYTSIAIKGLLFHYKPTKATITVDGVKHTYEKVWLAPTMHGRFYGGGMLPTPGQTRDENDKLSVMVMYGKGKIKTLMVFPSIFKGEHVKHKDMVEVLSGKRIKVEFDKPTALQIDGETILNVTSYTATVA